MTGTYSKPEMSVIDRRIQRLKEQSFQLAALLDDPQPGLYTWLRHLCDVRFEIDAILDGERD